MAKNRIPMYPRDGAASFKLPSEKEGTIQRMIPLGEFAEMFTEEETFKVQSPESVDPARVNPHAMWVTAKIADVGSSSPIVARTLIMAHDMLRNRIPLSDDEKIKNVLLLVHKIKNNLLQCSHSSATYIEAEKEQAEVFANTVQGRGTRAYANFPVIPDIESTVTNFLISARRIITEVCQIPVHFWDTKQTHSSLDYLLDKELVPRLGNEHRMVVWFKERADRIRRIIEFRNGQEHGTTTKGAKLVIKNFELLPTNEVHVPLWYLDGQRPTSIAEEMPIMVEALVEFAETMLVGCIDVTLPDFPPMMVVQAEPKPVCPVKYELIVDASRLKFPTAEQETK